MKILLTGATGYIGKRLLPELVADGHHVVCCVRDRNRFNPPPSILNQIEVVEIDFLKSGQDSPVPGDIEIAFYLMHSMSTAEDYSEIELKVAQNFQDLVEHTSLKQVIYLSGIVNEDTLSTHLKSRKSVEVQLSRSPFHLTTLRAGIIIGSGSASFEIIRDLVEKLPVMIAPRWLNTRCQPVAISDVLKFLVRSINCRELFDQNYDIGGPDILTYKEMLLGYAKVRGLRRYILTVPVMTPRVSSYWLYFVTSTSYKLAKALVESMKVEVICRNAKINNILNVNPITYRKSLEKTLTAIDNKLIISSWKDSLVSGRFDHNISEFIEVPTFGCLRDVRSEKIRNVKKTKELIWRIGGESGWYYGDWLWEIRGLMDKMVGGVGLRRGRTHPENLAPGDSLDFWRVLYSDRQEGRLLLFAEMKLPGEAWLEFKLDNGHLIQTATFRPKGILGRLYWYSVWIFHGFVFGGLIRKLTTS
ncbi:MAG: SDR family oxidoreductase [Saprospiraceae bacterium]|nr:SDR family oxidoreductase [Saprospiraceae bacterium]